MSNSPPALHPPPPAPCALPPAPLHTHTHPHPPTPLHTHHLHHHTRARATRGQPPPTTAMPTRRCPNKVWVVANLMEKDDDKVILCKNCQARRLFGMEQAPDEKGVGDDLPCCAMSF